MRRRVAARPSSRSPQRSLPVSFFLKVSSRTRSASRTTAHSDRHDPILPPSEEGDGRAHEHHDEGARSADDREEADGNDSTELADREQNVEGAEIGHENVSPEAPPQRPRRSTSGRGGAGGQRPADGPVGQKRHRR